MNSITKKTTVAICLVATPALLRAQIISNQNPLPGSYTEVRSTDSHQITVNDGVIASQFRAFDNSTLNQAGGYTYRNFATDSSTINQTGGSSIMNFSLGYSEFNHTGGSSRANFSSGKSTFTQSGGTTGSNFARSDSTLNQTGGESKYLYSHENSIVNKSGGHTTYAYAGGDSVFNITGGSLGTELVAQQNATINIWAKDFTGSDITPGPSGYASYSLSELPAKGNSLKTIRLSLNWDTGEYTTFNFTAFDSNSKSSWKGTLNVYDTDTYFANSFYADVSPVPEPSTVAALSLMTTMGLLYFRRKRKKQAI